MKSWIAIILVWGLASCTPLEREKPQEFVTVGTGFIESVETVHGTEGKTTGDRAVVGLLAGGPVVMIGAMNTESDPDRVRKQRYTVRLPGGQRTFVSYAVLKSGDCVKVEQVQGGQVSILTRLPRNRCVNS